MDMINVQYLALALKLKEKTLQRVIVIADLAVLAGFNVKAIHLAKRQQWKHDCVR